MRVLVKAPPVLQGGLGRCAEPALVWRVHVRL